MLRNTERLENVLFQSGNNFTLKNVVTLGSKSGIGNRLDPIYSRTYNSTKYNDRNTLEVVRFNKGDYLVFAYNDFDNKINEEIYISYPHMKTIILFLSECLEFVNTEGVFTNNSVSGQYKDTIVESSEFSSGKKMIAAPAVWDGRDNKIKKGLLLYLNSDDAMVPLDVDVLDTLYYIVSNFHLGIQSQLLLNSGMLYELESTRGASSIGTTTGQSFINKNTIGGQPKRGLFSNSNGNKSALGGSRFAGRTPQPQVQHQEQPQEQVNQPVQQPQEPEETFEQQPQQPPKRGISMTDVLNTANEIEVDDIGDVEI